MSVSTEQIATRTAGDYADQLLQAALGTIEVMSIYLGGRLGWYRALADGEPATPKELIARAGGNERYAREWLEQQAVYGLLEVEEGVARRFSLSPAAAEVLTDPHNLNYLAPLARMLSASAIQLPKLADAFRDGGGVNWAEFGEDARESQADMNRPWYEKALPAALARVPEVHEVLQRPGARLADIGFGFGWSSIALAKAYPQATVHGFDLDRPSVDAATRNAVVAGVDDRVQFSPADAAAIDDESFDAIFAFECIHDMAHPVEVLTAARRALKPDGVMVVMDEAVAESFTAPGDDTEKLMYGFSILLCLADGLSHDHSVGTGTVMRPATLRRYARQAGFRDVAVLPIDDFGFWRFYRLHV
ncbi:MAG: class I SAM-dependent methyltransferase [Actinomycetota bacterium]|nr:class I SAM-dependent methyltransferase [Actinomycetota bacterium]